eukprot:760853-Hanusia_phi.AAC.1
MPPFLAASSHPSLQVRVPSEMQLPMLSAVASFECHDALSRRTAYLHSLTSDFLSLLLKVPLSPVQACRVEDADPFVRLHEADASWRLGCHGRLLSRPESSARSPGS